MCTFALGWLACCLSVTQSLNLTLMRLVMTISCSANVKATCNTKCLGDEIMKFLLIVIDNDVK